MKKKILSIVLAIVLLPTIFLFSGCGADNSYNLLTFSRDFDAVIEKYDNIALTTDGEIEFLYSNYSYAGNDYFINQINSNTPYTYLNTFYNVILNNALTFVYEYRVRCSDDSITASGKLRDELKTNLDEFDNALSKTSRNVDMVADIMAFNISGDLLNPLFMARLENLFDTYDDLWQAAFNLTNSLASIYYYHALNYPNPDYSQMTLSSYDANRFIALLPSRLAYQKANMTHTYVAINVKGGVVSNNLTTKTSGIFGTLPATFSTYKTAISSLGDYDNVIASINFGLSQSIGDIINESTKKADIYHASIALYNLQASIENDMILYKKACNEITYSYVKSNINATIYELAYASIIENFNVLINQYNTALLETIDILRTI